MPSRTPSPTKTKRTPQTHASDRLPYLETVTKRGKVFRYVRKGGGRVRLPDLPTTSPEFLRAYRAALREAPDAKPAAGTIAAAVRAYRASRRWQELAPATRTQRGAHMDAIEAKGGKARIDDIEPRHIRRDLVDLAPHAAGARLKTWRALLGWALDAGLIETNPARDVKAPRPRSTGGHRTWTRAEVEQAREALPAGTKPRLLLELAFWTGARRSDLVGIGRGNVGDDGWLRFEQVKTNTPVELPFTAPYPELAHDQAHLLAALDAAPADGLFLQTAYGRPHSVKGLGNWFHEHVVAPGGLPDGLSLHGLRKARATDLAERGWSSWQIAAWLGHESPREGEVYTRRADRRRLLDR